MGKVAPWGSLRRTGVRRGAMGAGCLPAAAVPAASCCNPRCQPTPSPQPRQRPPSRCGLLKIACRRAGSSHGGGARHLYSGYLACGGTSIDFPAALCSIPHTRCLKEEAGTGAKTAALVLKWPLGAGSAPCRSCAGIRLQPGSHQWFFLSLRSSNLRQQEPKAKCTFPLRCDLKKKEENPEDTEHQLARGDQNPGGLP